ncbi:MAG TPA: hypothetical protein VMV72_16185 [Verrucomicrobiae bacterium]|nr:hypothetical protein [Verrucomicrobiae bacterium]
MKRSFARLWPVDFAVLLALTTLSLEPSTRAQSTQPGRIFSSTGASYGGLIAFNPDGSNIVNWTANTFDDGPCGSESPSKSMHPSVALNGQIVFMSSRDEIINGLPSPAFRVEIMNADGTSRRALTTRTGAVLSDGTVVADMYPVISPDGTKVAFISRRNDVWAPSCPCFLGINSVFIVNVDGTGLHPLTASQTDPSTGAINGSIFSVAWSPDSSRLAFRGQRLTPTGTDTNLHFHMVVGIIDSTGSNESTVAVLDSTGQSSGVDWSPDGRYLVADYGAEAQGAAERRLCIFDLEADTSTQLLQSAIGQIGSGAGTVRFSPDSQRLLFSHGAALATMNRDGTDIVTLDNVPIAAGQPLWWMPGPPIPPPARLELTPDPVALFTGGLTAQVTPSLYDAQSNVIVTVATGWSLDCCNSSTPRFDSAGLLTPGTYPWAYSCQFSASNGGLTNSVTILNNPLAGDLSLNLLGSPTAVLVSNNVTYSFSVTNYGPITVNNVTLTDTLPATADIVSMSTNCTAYGATVSCNLGALASNDGAEVTILVNPTVTGLMTNTATVTASDPDPDMSNNTALVVTTINGPPPNQPPVAICHNVTVNVDGDCLASVSPADVDNGSYDPDGTIVARTLSPAGPYAPGTTLVTLTVADNLGASNACSATVTVITNQPDLRPAVDMTGSHCTDTGKKKTCSLTVHLDIYNHRAAFATGDMSLVSTCTRARLGTNCKLKGSLQMNEMNVSCSPAATLSLYLSDDAAYDANDVLLQRVVMSKHLKSIARGKPLKINARGPKNVDISGKYVLVVLDDTGLIIETDTTNNTAAFGPLP